MQKRPLRLRSPIHIGGNFNLSHGVGFNAGLHVGRGLVWEVSKSGHDGISSNEEPNIIRRRERQSLRCDPSVRFQNSALPRSHRDTEKTNFLAKLFSSD